MFKRCIHYRGIQFILILVAILLITLRSGSAKDWEDTRQPLRLDAAIPQLAAKVRSITPEEAKKYKLSPDQGVTIVSLDRMGLLGRVGFEVGDMILELNSQPVDSVEGFIQLLRSFEANQRITLRVVDHRSGRIAYVQVMMP